MPHAFEQVSVDVPITKTPFVFTYGLTVTEVWRASSLAEQRLRDRVGRPWIIDLHNEITRTAGSMAFRRSMTSLGIGKPGEVAELGVKGAIIRVAPSVWPGREDRGHGLLLSLPRCSGVGCVNSVSARGAYVGRTVVRPPR
jgi:hypothetical protein